MLAGIDTKAATTSLAIAATAAAASYLLTRPHYQKNVVTERSDAYQKDVEARVKINSERKVMGLPSGIKLE